MSAWLDAYPDDFRSPPHHTAVRRLRQFVAHHLPDDVELQRRVADRLASLRRQDAAAAAAVHGHRRPQSAGAQRQRASCFSSSQPRLFHAVRHGTAPRIAGRMPCVVPYRAMPRGGRRIRRERTFKAGYLMKQRTQRCRNQGACV